MAGGDQWGTPSPSAYWPSPRSWEGRVQGREECSRPACPGLGVCVPKAMPPLQESGTLPQRSLDPASRPGKGGGVEEAAFTPHPQPGATTPATTRESRAHVPVGGRRAHPRKEGAGGRAGAAQRMRAQAPPFTLGGTQVGKMTFDGFSKLSLFHSSGLVLCHPWFQGRWQPLGKLRQEKPGFAQKQGRSAHSPCWSRKPQAPGVSAPPPTKLLPQDAQPRPQGLSCPPPASPQGALLGPTA